MKRLFTFMIILAFILFFIFASLGMYVLYTTGRDVSPPWYSLLGVYFFIYIAVTVTVGLIAYFDDIIRM